MPSDTTGDRLREARKRADLTQRELATAAGVSVATIRKLEQGAHRDARLETARALAAVLRIPTTALVGGDADRELADVETTDQWAAVRRALDAPAVDSAGEPPTTGGVSAALRAARHLQDGSEYEQLAGLLPALLRDADALPADAKGRRVRVQVQQLAAWMLTQTRQWDAAGLALDRAEAEAQDRLTVAAVTSGRCWLLLRQGRLEETRTLAARWADELEPRWSRATPDELAAWGWMLIRLAAAAVRDNRQAEAEDALRLARSAAVALGREHAAAADYPRVFGPGKITRQRLEHHAVVRQPDRVLKLAAGMPLVATTRTRRSLLDVADAHVRTRGYAEAEGILLRLHEATPEWLAQQRYARDIVGAMTRRRRRLSPGLRALVGAVKLPL
jgi:transcriptional regulator with XRE-family HTH domain